MKPDLSIICPVYQSAETVDELVRRIGVAIGPADVFYELILVDDGSTDQSWEKVAAQCASNQHVTGIKLARNYGQHMAIKAGLTEASGASIVVMDCDLQDLPEDIPRLFQTLIDRQVEAVFALRRKQYDTYLERFLSSGFYRVLQLVSGVKLSGSVANFGVYRKEVIQKVLAEDSDYFFFPLAVRKAVHYADAIEVVHARRYAGRSAYSIRRAFALAMSVLSAHSFLSYLRKVKQQSYAVDQMIRNLG